MFRYQIIIEYDGTNFVGWQSQINGKSVEPINLLVVGAGSRGSGYASYAAAHPDEVRVVGVAEPREIYRQRMVEEYDIAQENAFADWRQAVAVSPWARWCSVELP